MPKSIQYECAWAIHAKLQELFPGEDVRVIVDAPNIKDDPVGVSVWHESGVVTAVYLHVQEH